MSTRPNSIEITWTVVERGKAGPQLRAGGTFCVEPDSFATIVFAATNTKTKHRSVSMCQMNGNDWSVPLNLVPGTYDCEAYLTVGRKNGAAYPESFTRRGVKVK